MDAKTAVDAVHWLVRMPTTLGDTSRQFHCVQPATKVSAQRNVPVNEGKTGNESGTRWNIRFDKVTRSCDCHQVWSWRGVAPLCEMKSPLKFKIQFDINFKLGFAICAGSEIKALFIQESNCLPKDRECSHRLVCCVSKSSVFAIKANNYHVVQSGESGHMEVPVAAVNQSINVLIYRNSPIWCCWSCWWVWMHSLSSHWRTFAWRCLGEQKERKGKQTKLPQDSREKMHALIMMRMKNTFGESIRWEWFCKILHFLADISQL